MSAIHDPAAALPVTNCMPRFTTAAHASAGSAGARLQVDVRQGAVVDDVPRDAVPDLHPDFGAALGLQHVARQVLAVEVPHAAPVLALRAQRAPRIAAPQAPAAQRLKSSRRPPTHTCVIMRVA